MELNMLFTIGEMAKLCNVTPKTLRFYNQIGLLEPAEINPENGYRFYIKQSITRVLSIKQLQDTGMSLEDIQRFFKANSQVDVVDQLSQALNMQEQNVRAQIDKLQTSLNKIKALQKQCSVIGKSFHYADVNHLIFREITQRRLVFSKYRGKFDPSQYANYFTQMLSSIKKESSNLENVIVSSPMALYNSLTKIDEADIKFGYEVTSSAKLSLPIYNIKGGTYACYIYKGSYQCLNREFLPELCLHIHSSGYEMQFPIVEYFYINEASTHEESNYLTEIQFPVNSQNIH